MCVRANPFETSGNKKESNNYGLGSFCISIKKHRLRVWECLLTIQEHFAQATQNIINGLNGFFCNF